MTQLAEVLPCTLEIKGSSPGSQPFLRVISALLSFLTLSMVPYLKKSVKLIWKMKCNQRGEVCLLAL